MRAQLKWIVVLVYSLGSFYTAAQGKANWAKDTARIGALNKKAFEIRYKDTQESIKIAYKALELSKKINYQMGIAKSSFELAKAYFLIDDFKNSLEHAVKAIEICEKEKNDFLLSASYLALANIYVMQLNHSQSMIYLNKSLAIKKRIGDTEGETNIYNNKGFSHYKHKNYDSAYFWFRKSNMLSQKIGYKRGISNTLQNMGHVYNDQNMYDSALHYYNASLPVSIELADLPLVSQNYLKIAGIYFKQKNYEKMGENLLNGLTYAEKMGLCELLCNYYRELSLLYEHKNDKAKAYAYAKKYYTYSDSLNQFENSKRVNEVQFSYEIERKAHEQELADQQKTAEHNAELSKRNTIVYAAIGGLLLVMVLLLYMVRTYRQKKKANLVLEEKNQLIEEQKRFVEEKNKDITDSINYAKRIQLALLKEQTHVSSHLPRHFIYFRPKDIVAGDFYWASEKQEHLYLAAADCTGHGVPGAFLTMLGVAFLNEINASTELLTPAQILDKLRARFIQELSQTGATGENKDGMDISMMRLNLKTKELQWAGANNPLWIIKKSTTGNEFVEIKADKQPIGYHSNPKPFTNHKIELEKDDAFYLFTDGYADQFGGPQGKKFKYSQFKEKLNEIYGLDLEKQREMLDHEFENWKGEYEQLDDVCVIGVRV
ncbi:MAG TPA: SpoIIE family protein phosphatase [Flavobacteriales bacterium]|nr:SpoIIE family protein phosphatase [Flavobacteriales bacterium]